MLVSEGGILVVKESIGASWPPHTLGRGSLKSRDDKGDRRECCLKVKRLLSRKKLMAIIITDGRSCSVMVILFLPLISTRTTTQSFRTQEGSGDQPFKVWGICSATGRSVQELGIT